ncbi:GNAT family N-acetyltransferase [Alkalihalobacillus sp. 1P02AB]|uniref:GNAT family N-acetyltransferase n=1 Tax=Alkalihalobacillus sp. 1P02AB TaxID=3132260 RepID=UPI0039A56FDF
MLTGEQLQEIKTLQNRCEKYENIRLKLNWELLEARSDSCKEDFFQYEDEQLVGYLAIYRFGNKAEICGMVDPDYRAQGIFTSLLEEAKVELKDDIKVCINTPALSDSAKAWIHSQQLPLAFSERQMKFNTDTKLRLTTELTTLVEATEEDFDLLASLDVSCFQFSKEEARKYNEKLLTDKDNKLYLIEVEGRKIGKMRVSQHEKERWIYGFAIFPEEQGKGYGKEALIKVVQEGIQQNLDIFLEVDGLNVGAKRLYEQCGFETYEVQDYFTIR